MEHMPVFGLPIGDMTVYVFFSELYHLHPSKQLFCLLPRMESQGTSWLIPFVVNTKQLADKYTAGSYRRQHPRANLVETVSRIKREGEVGVHQVVSLKRKILERR